MLSIEISELLYLAFIQLKLGWICGLWWFAEIYIKIFQSSLDSLLLESFLFLNNLALFAALWNLSGFSALTLFDALCVNELDVVGTLVPLKNKSSELILGVKAHQILAALYVVGWRRWWTAMLGRGAVRIHRISSSVSLFCYFIERIAALTICGRCASVEWS